MWYDGIRELTEEEKKKIYDYLKERDALNYYDEILSSKYLKMDFLDFAEQNKPMDYASIMYYVVDQ